ncbi:FecR family protein [Ravibacter arvi]|uniref:FecR family protein n=1 Tax=Ravibacter arvi TaxID=2051041 RepID=A0ABP8LWG1_9BACT
MKITFSKQRIFDYFDGKVTPLEAKQVEEWLENQENEERFYAWLHEWELERLQYTPDPVRGIGKLRSFLDKKERTPTSVTQATAPPQRSRLPGRVRMGYWAAACAAVAILLLAVTAPFYRKLANVTYTTGYGETRSLLLSDGSSVVLNANTSLQVPRFGFGNDTREVVLQGEALFSVAHLDKDRKFVVKTLNAAEVVVLGTEFSVFARSRGTRVKLNKGKVELRYRGADQRFNQVVLAPGDQVTLDAKGGMVLDEVAQAEPSGNWAARQFRFEKTPLSEILHMLSENYDLTVSLEKDELGELSLTGTYEANRGEELLLTIAEVLDLDVKKEKDKYKLVPKPE